MLIRKMWRDILYHRISFIAIFLMTFLGMFIYSGINSEWNGMKINAQAFYNRTNLADAWFISSEFQDDNSYQVLNSLVESFEGRLMIPVTTKDDKPKNIDLYAVDTMQISKFEVVEGVLYKEGQEGVWLDNAYAQANTLTLGDTITLTYQDQIIEKEIIGLIQSPEYIYSAANGEMMPDHKMNGFCYISKQTVPFLEMLPFNQIMLETDMSKESLQVMMEQHDAFKGSTLLMQNDHSSVAMLNNEINQHKAMSDIFPIAFLLIGLLTTITTMSKLTIDQRNQIGILQALGFPYHKILTHYISHGFLICSAGSIIGYLLGPILLPSMIYPMLETMYTIPELHGVPLESGYLLLCCCILLSFLISLWTVRKQLCDHPAKTLRPLEPKINRMLIHKKHNKLNRSFSTSWNMRDIYRNKLRSFMTFFGVMGCSALIFCSSGLYDTMTKLTDWMYQDIATYETKILLKQDTTKEEKEKLKEHTQGEYLLETFVELKKDDIRKNGSLNVQESTTFIHLESDQKEYIELPTQGIAISKKMADTLKVEQGDTIQWRMYGDEQWQSSFIEHIIRTPVAQGITMSKSLFQQTHEFQPYTILTNQKTIIDDQQIESIVHKANLMNNLDAMMESMNSIIFILIIAACLLGGVVLYNLGTLSFLERQRELATLKVLGFSSHKLKRLISQQNIWLTCIGILFGIPCGYGLIYMMIITIGESMDILIQIDVRTYIFTITGTYLLSYFITRVLSKKLSHIDMVSALKSIE